MSKTGLIKILEWQIKDFTYHVKVLSLSCEEETAILPKRVFLMFRTCATIWSSIDSWLVSKTYHWWKNCYSSLMAFARRNIYEKLVLLRRIFVRPVRCSYYCTLFGIRRSTSTSNRFISCDLFYCVFVHVI